MMPENDWDDRVLCAVGELSRRYRKIERSTVLMMVAARFAARFDAADRLYEGTQPAWHRRVTEAVARLREAGLVARWRLTDAGRAALDAACDRAHGTPERDLPERGPRTDVLTSGVLTAALRGQLTGETGPAGRSQQPIPVLIELNLRHRRGPKAALARLRTVWALLDAEGAVAALADQYAVGELTSAQIEGLVAADAVPMDWADRAVHHVWPDFELHPQIDVSARTVKARAAQRSFGSFGDGIVWAVVDSGIQGDHPHFQGYDTLHDPLVAELHRDFTDPGGDPLVDETGHGTHVAGILAGGLERWGGTADRILVAERRYNVADPRTPIEQPRTVADPAELAGVAPRAKLVSLKVLGGSRTLAASTARVIRALAYVRELNAAGGKLLRVHGVNLSLGYEFDPHWFACGRSPLCLEVDKLVRSGVVVVVAAGNSAYIRLDPELSAVDSFSAAMTINDPGNAERAVTVGATHRESPHAHGVSYFSSRGPTADGRRKPDLVAPGERIASAAAGAKLESLRALLGELPADRAVYTEDSGTSMAAPHVSGAIAAFLSVQREFIGEPEAVKRIFMESATSLNRDPAFQGAGLVDLMRALQSV
ncbi:S8 family serine peptidase [Nocardia sp. NPDC057353]|uniref:S8 family serine peptidase n=1 Tax=Nocardia sp. NPDC057353 TaxID=3346104 RepID=UPI0036451DB6